MYLSYLTLLSSTALDDIYNALQLTILQINIPAQAYRDFPLNGTWDYAILASGRRTCSRYIENSSFVVTWRR